MSSGSGAPERVVIAEVLKPRGIRGEVTAKSLTDIPGRLETLKRAQARLASGGDRAVKLETAWPHKDGWVLKFEGIDSIEQAAEFQDAELWVPKEERAALPEGEYFQSDLIGLLVVEAGSGREVGRVEGLERYGGPPMLALTYEGRDVLIPFVPEICRVDLASRRIEAALPEGLLDL